MTDEVAVWEADYGEDVASVFSVPSPRDEPETAAEPEMPAAKAQPRRPAAAYAGQHPARDHAERPLTANERRALRQASNQMINFRYWTKSKAGCLFPPPHLAFSGGFLHFPSKPRRVLEPCGPSASKAAANTTWQEQLVHTTPGFPRAVRIVPQREEAQLTARLADVTPAEMCLYPESSSSDEG